MRISRKVFGALFVVVTGLLGGCGLAVYWLDQQRLQNNPARVFRRYEPELRRYAQRLEQGHVMTNGGEYALPQFLITHGAKHVRRVDHCFVIVFGFMPTDAVPELWYSSEGFHPFPPGLSERKRKSFFQFVELAPDWGACLWDQ